MHIFLISIFIMFIIIFFIPQSSFSVEPSKELPGVIIKFCANRPIYNIDPYLVDPHEILSKCIEAYDGYSPTNRIFALIYAPSWNTNSHKIDSIGNSIEHPITVYTSKGHRNLVGTDTDFIAGFGECTGFKELGPDSGLFAGKIALTGFKKDIDGDGNLDIFGATNCGVASAYGDDVNVVKIQSEVEGGMTLAWEVFDGYTISKSANYSFREAQIFFDNTNYEINDKVTVIMKDLDYQITPGDNKPLNIRVWSDTDKGGIEVKIFWKRDVQLPIYFDDSYYGSFVLTTEKESRDDGRLRVTEGDNIYVEFDDYTLPHPHGNEEFLTIQNSSRIFFEKNNPYGIVLNSFATSKSNNNVNSFLIEERIQFSSELLNETSNPKTIICILQIKNEQDIVQKVFLSTVNLTPESFTKIDQSWIPEIEGNYLAEMYVWDQISDPNPLLSPKTLQLSITN